MNKKYFSAASITAATTALSIIAIASPAFAADANVNANVNANISGDHMKGGMRGNMGMRPMVVGTVSAINGNSITISGRQGFGTSTPATTFIIDATNAKITKDKATGTISSIVVGDTVMAEGTISGSNVVATMIHDGVMMRGPGMNGGMNKDWGAKLPAGIQGNGQPVIAGKVSSISGSTLNITTTSNIQYTVDATNAKILQGKDTATLSTIIVGDSVIVQGTTSGTSVVASTIFDEKAPKQNSGKPSAPRGFFGGIGQFFTHLFGF